MVVFIIIMIIIYSTAMLQRWQTFFFSMFISILYKRIKALYQVIYTNLNFICVMKIDNKIHMTRNKRIYILINAAQDILMRRSRGGSSEEADWQHAQIDPQKVFLKYFWTLRINLKPAPVCFSLFPSLSSLRFPTFFRVLCLQVRQETVEILFSGRLFLLENKKQGEVLLGKKPSKQLVTYMRVCSCYLEHHHKTVFLITEPQLFLRFLCFFSLSVSLEGQMQSHHWDYKILEPSWDIMNISFCKSTKKGTFFILKDLINIRAVWTFWLTHTQHISHPLPTRPLLLNTLLSKRWERWDLFLLNGRLDDAAEPGLVFLGAAQGRGHDGVHLSLVLHVQLDQVLPLLVRALVFLLEFKDVIYCDLGERAQRQSWLSREIKNPIKWC